MSVDPQVNELLKSVKLWLVLHKSNIYVLSGLEYKDDSKKKLEELKLYAEVLLPNSYLGEDW